jgi:hypothetical protein
MECPQTLTLNRFPPQILALSSCYIYTYAVVTTVSMLYHIHFQFQTDSVGLIPPISIGDI